MFDVNKMTPFISLCHPNCHSAWIHSPARSIRKEGEVRSAQKKSHLSILSLQMLLYPPGHLHEGKHYANLVFFNMHADRNT